MPRSGAGADQPTYTPTWVLYKDLTFLEDIIKPRKTSSNYKSKAVRTSSSVQCTPAPSDSQVTVLCTIPPFSATSPDTSSSISSWNWDLHTRLANTDESSTEVSEDPYSPPPLAILPPATPPAATLPPATLPPATLPSTTLPSTTLPLPTLPPATPISAVTSRSESNISQVHRAMSKITTKRKVPPPDSFATRKRQEIEAVNKSFIEQNKELTDLAAKIGEAITTQSAQPSAPSAVVSNASPGVQPMLSAIGFALSAIPEHALLECLISVLQHINDFSKTRVDKHSEARLG
ncbi:mucin-2-like [Temnothorax curvispinosus]|uniref:Mucin-2-like n=1 Tax=Temnothorax curvispinosus TaxID=300111 RepID=A0A6J1QXJ4_9HYME|nr:mucin-2-like [Temnothorax curvispinosus]